MILDYVESTSNYVLLVPRAKHDIQALMREHGLDLSLPRSDSRVACMFTQEPYAAAAFGEYASDKAKAKLAPILDAVKASWADSSGAHIAVPADKELWPFQKADIEYALARRNTLIADEPGLGKTPIAICYANEIKAKRVLVICPAAIRLQWVNRIREWSTMRWPYHVHPILNARHGVHPTAEWTVVSYDLARTEAIGRALAAGTYDLLILDEAHYLKTIDSKRTQAILGGGHHRLFEPLESKCGAILALTGTPLVNRPREAYTLSRALCWDAIDWMSEDSFQERFNPSKLVERLDPKTGKTTRYIDERSGRHFELQNRLRANFMTRHCKREVMTQLNMPVYDIIQLEETGAVRQALEAERLLDIDPDNLEGANAAVLGHISVIRKQMGVALAPQVADYVDMLLTGGEDKLVLFGWHVEVLNILQERLAKHGVVRVDGSTSTKTRQAHIKAFIEDRGIKIFLANLLSGGVGVDGLQLVCCHALIAEPDWTPGNNIQAFDRLDRGGQTRTVQGDIFVAPGSFAERILASALRKLHVIDKALDRRVA